ncbi:MAG: hypothetical protein PHX61_03730 [Alphaproteobacteria bacterium]|nr:hypothetical protein [Alphaproteobacteria bacterium]
MPIQDLFRCTFIRKELWITYVRYATSLLISITVLSACLFYDSVNGFKYWIAIEIATLIIKPIVTKQFDTLKSLIDKYSLPLNFTSKQNSIGEILFYTLIIGPFGFGLGASILFTLYLNGLNNVLDFTLYPFILSRFMLVGIVFGLIMGITGFISQQNNSKKKNS